jgi:hypothetical protein
VTRPSSLPRLLQRYWLWTLALTALSLVYTAVMTRLLHARTPYGLNLIWGTDRWWDFLIYRARFAHFRRPEFWSIVTFPFVYPAPLAVIFGLLYKLAHPLRDYLALCVLALLAWVAWLSHALRRAGVTPTLAFGFAVTIAATAWPVWFFFTTANIEGVVAFTLGLGIIAALRRRWWLAAALIGIAGSMKLFPFMLLGLLLSQRRYKEFAFGIAVSAAVTVGSLAILGPSVVDAWRIIPLGIAFEKDAYVFSLAPNDTFINHSLFVPVKLLVAHLHGVPSAPRSNEMARNHGLLERPYEIYVALTALFGFIAYFARIRRLPLLNQTLALTVCAVLLPPISLDYTLLHLLVPFGFVCLYATRAERIPFPRPSLTCLLTCFTLIFTLGTFFTVKHRFAAPVRIAALAMLLLQAMRVPLPWPDLDQSQDKGAAA